MKLRKDTLSVVDEVICPRNPMVTAWLVSSVALPVVVATGSVVPDVCESQSWDVPKILKSVWPVNRASLAPADRVTTVVAPMRTSPENPTAVPVCAI